jgi:hypothetical protein
MISPDGVNWTAQTAAGQNAWDGITYGAGTFVAVSTDNTIMTSTDFSPNTLSLVGNASFSGDLTATNLFASNLSGNNTGDLTLLNSTNGLTLSGQVLNVALASSTATGTLSIADWNTFNNKLSTTTASDLYATEGDNDLLSYRYNTQPLLYWSGAGPQVLKTISVQGAGNYGVWDGEDLWVPDFGGNTISKVNEDGDVLDTYQLDGNTQPLQLAYDGKNIWIASGDCAAHLKRFDPTTGTTTGDWTMNPSCVGAGGIQGITWDGKNIWIGVAQQGAGAGSGLVEKIDPNSGDVLASIGGQTNANGMIVTNLSSVSGTTEYIWVANSMFISKIKASDMTYQAIPNPDTTYRLATDGTYIYGANWDNGKIFKYLASDGYLVATWQGEVGLNTIAFDGKYIWTTGGGNNTIQIFDRDTGNIIDSLDNAGYSDLVFDGTYMWSIIDTGTVKKLSIGNQMGDLKVTQSLSVMDENSDTSLFLSGTSSQNSFMLSNFGIGTTSASSVLTISGTPTSTLMRLVGFGSGALMSDANGVVYDNSDERLKDIAGTSTIGLSAIEGLNPINYHWNATSGLDMVNEYTGFSAQNVQANIPNAVGTDSKGYLTLDDRPIVAALVNSVKEIGSFITKVENGIAYLTNIVVERLTVGSTVSPEGITMYDRTTKQPYCVFMNNGVWSSSQGECQDLATSTDTYSSDLTSISADDSVSTSTDSTSSSETDSSSTIQTDASSTEDTTSTSTPDIPSDQNISTTTEDLSSTSSEDIISTSTSDISSDSDISSSTDISIEGDSSVTTTP